MKGKIETRRLPGVPLLRRLAVATVAVAVALLAHAQVPPESPFPSDIRQACAGCHVAPPPDILPRETWPATIHLMKGFALQGVGAPTEGPAPFVDFDLKGVVGYYQSLAPVSLPSPEAWPPPGADADRFARRAFPREAAPGLPLVANVAFLELDAKEHPLVVAADMGDGLVLGADPARPEGRLRVLGRVPHPAHVATADLDADGRRDLLVADLGVLAPSDEAKGSVVWLRRQPDGGFHAFTLASRLPRVADVQAADFDQDGDLDLVVAAFGWRWIGGIYLLENRTTDWTRPSFARRELDSRTGPIHVPVADLNGDGRPDFVAVIAQREAVVAFLGDGRGGFRRETVDLAPHPGWGSSGLSLVDFDRDGDLDALVTNGDMLDDFRVKPDHGIRWLENRGSFPWVPHRIAGLPGAARARAVDLDGDGDLDVVACSFVPSGPETGPATLPDPASLVWLEQTEPGRFTRHTLERGGRHVSFDAADDDGDGDTDLVVGSFQGGNDVALEVWENLTARPVSALAKHGHPQPR